MRLASDHKLTSGKGRPMLGDTILHVDMRNDPFYLFYMVALSKCMLCSQHACSVGTHFPLCYESTAESGPDNWIQESMGRGFEPIGAHGLAAGLWIPATGCTRILMPVPNAKEPNWPVARPVARPCIKAGESLQSPRPTQLIFVGTHFPLCYESTAESGPDNWIQLSGPLSAVLS